MTTEKHFTFQSVTEAKGLQPRGQPETAGGVSATQPHSPADRAGQFDGERFDAGLR